MKTDNILFTPEAFEDYRYWQGEDKKTLKRINALIDDILRNGNEGIGKPELLKNNFAGFYIYFSHQINKMELLHLI